MKNEKLKILITGASGQLGYELQRVLSEYELVLTDKTLNSKSEKLNPKQVQSLQNLNSKFIHKSKILNLKSSFLELDITNTEKVHEVFEKEKPDWVIHTAAYTDVDGAETNQDLAFEINRDGSRNIAEASKSVGAKLIAISTDYVFDGEKNQSYTEDDIPNPLGVYGESKLAGEIQTILKCPDAIILRTAWLYGGLPATIFNFQFSISNQDQKLQIPNYPDITNNIYKNFPNTILYNAMQGKELKVVNDQFGNPTYAGDLAVAIKQIIEKDGIEPGIYNAVNSDSASWYDFAKFIIENCKLENENCVVTPVTTVDFSTKAPRPKNTVLATAKLQSKGIELPSWQDGVKRFFAQH